MRYFAGQRDRRLTGSLISSETIAAANVFLLALRLRLVASPRPHHPAARPCHDARQRQLAVHERKAVPGSVATDEPRSHDNLPLASPDLEEPSIFVRSARSAGDHLSYPRSWPHHQVQGFQCREREPACRRRSPHIPPLPPFLTPSAAH